MLRKALDDAAYITQQQQQEQLITDGGDVLSARAQNSDNDNDIDNDNDNDNDNNNNEHQQENQQQDAQQKQLHGTVERRQVPMLTVNHDDESAPLLMKPIQVVTNTDNNNNNNGMYLLQQQEQQQQVERYGAMVEAATTTTSTTAFVKAMKLEEGNGNNGSKGNGREGLRMLDSNINTSIGISNSNNSNSITGYGDKVLHNHDNDEDDYDETYGEHDDDEDDDEEDDDDDDEYIHSVPWWRVAWENIVSGIVVVANVENLWDSPPSSPKTTTTMSTTTTTTTATPPLGPSLTRRISTSCTLHQQQQSLNTGTARTSTANSQTTMNATSTTCTNIYRSLYQLFAVARDGIIRRNENDNNTSSTSNNNNNNNNTTNEWIIELYNTACTKLQKKNTIVLFWFVVLATSYATERSTFKLLVDRTDPFRLVSVQFITACHAIMVGIGLILEQRYNNCSNNGNSSTSNSFSNNNNSSSNNSSNSNKSKMMPLGIPLADVGLMAILDSISLLLVFITGSHVPPTLTVILVQFTIPLTAFLTQFIHPDGHWNCLFKNNNFFSLSPDDDDDDDGTDTEANDTILNNNRNGTNLRSTKDTPPPPPPNPSSTTATTTTTTATATATATTTTSTTTAGNSSQKSQQQGTSGIPQSTTIFALGEGSALPGWGGLSSAHVWGSIVLSLAVLLALVPALYSLADPDFFIYADTIPIRTAINTILYLLSCFPSAASQLYKEHVFVQYKQPVNMNYLNFLLSIIQFCIAVMVAPLLFPLQGLGALSGPNGSDAEDHEVFVAGINATAASIEMSSSSSSMLLTMVNDTMETIIRNIANATGTTMNTYTNSSNSSNYSYNYEYDDWTSLYPPSSFRQNYIDSIKCLFNVLEESDQDDKYPEYAVCNFAFGLVLFHSFSIIAVGVAVDKIVNAGATKVMYRGISAGIIVAVVCMRYYDLHLPDFNYGPIISTLNLVCVLLLIIGSEMYHRVSLPESTFETVYPEITFQVYD